MAKNELAKARDVWFASIEGKHCINTDLLHRSEDAQYLRNRIERAFCAGWNARDTLTTEHDAHD